MLLDLGALALKVIAILGVAGLLALLGIGFFFLKLRFMKAAILSVIWLVIVTIGTVMAMPAFISLDEIKPQISAAVKQFTQRDLSLNGPISFSLYPVLGLTVNELTFANTPGAKEASMLSVEQAAVGISLTALMQKRLEISEFRLLRPTILVTTDKAGKTNWQLAGNSKQDTSKTAKDQGLPGGFDISVARLQIIDGVVNYRATGKPPLTLEDVDVLLTMPSLSQPAALDTAANWKGQRLSLGAEITLPEAFLGTAETPVQVTARIGKDSAVFKGSAGRASYDGTIKLNVASLPALLEWATGQAPALPLQGLVATSDMGGDKNSITLSNLNLKLDDISVSGTAGAKFTNKPALTANLEISPINLDKLTAPAAPTTTSETAAATAPPSLTGLNAFNADVTAELAGLTSKGVSVGATTATVKLAGGKLNASMTPASLFEGTVSGSATADASSNNFTANLKLNGVAMEPVLTKFANFTRLSGKGDAVLNVRGSVGTPDHIKKSLNGDGKIMFRDGALKGVNLGAMVREAKSFLSGGAKPVADKNSQTDFTELSGTYTITEGIVKNDDLKMLSPLLRVTGAGTINLPEQTVNYRIAANLVADLTGQGGAMDKGGVVLPVLVKGPFTNLSYTPDLAGLVTGNLNNVGQVLDTVKNLDGKNLKESGKKALEGLLKPQQAPAEGQPQPTKPEDVLKNLLGR